MKRFIILAIISTFGFSLFAQDSTKAKKPSKQERKEERQQRISAMIKQDEEGALIYNKQSIFGIQIRTNGYGLLYEKGKTKTRRKTTIYGIELTEIKDPKEEKTPTGIFSFNNPYIFGKTHNFYQFKIGVGQQYLFGQKGNKNGVALTGSYQGGVSLGLLRPYFLQVSDGGGSRDIKYTTEDSSAFLDPSVIIGSSGLGKGWNQMTLKPGALCKSGFAFRLGAL